MKVLLTMKKKMNQSNFNTQQQKNPGLSGDKEKAETPNGHIEHSNSHQNRKSIDAGTVDEVIELPLNDNQLPQAPENHSDVAASKTF